METEVTATSSKTTPSKLIRKSLRQNMVRNVNVYNRHVKKHMREYTCIKALGALREGRNNNPAHKDAVNSLIFVKRRKIRIGIASQLMIKI